jgi:hypothetical protein
MRNRNAMGLTLTRKLGLVLAATAALVVPVAVGLMNPPAIQAQDGAEWQTKAGGKMAFPLDAGVGYKPTGVLFRANAPLSVYIEFAYKISLAADQRREMYARLPKWVNHRSLRC